MHHREEIPNLIKLASMASSCPQVLQNVKGVLVPKTKQTAIRNRLDTAKLNVLITVNIEGPALNKFDFHAAYKEWTSEKGRMKT